ncbi:uncharacterized protein BXZ73DRAFT_49142 [Epithele typhae]|uniref:uncharacterized protein n=1 Tax=Epithele typhae TaxID=378194 RepID=UPI00200878CC|nr:uncharacterized protein BXZ73DRAFT_49142 [Epithele typhae]KAH9927191.1 hypothetical protein BXZ73DRAFT_49142 [Epithele typhae]
MEGHTCGNRCEKEPLPEHCYKRCAGCRKVWYCDKQCQTQHWPWHIFDCKTGTPISSVYYLARACWGDLVPRDPQTRLDYGFEKVTSMLGGHQESRLLGLYQGVLHQEVDLKLVRSWQRQGQLVQGIKSTFEKIPSRSRGQYYLWFLEHQSILEDPTNIDGTVTSSVADETANRILRVGWTHIGGSPHDSKDTIRAALAQAPPVQQACHNMYFNALSFAHPSPTLRDWTAFGFVAARSEGDEVLLGQAYAELVQACPFDEFCAAHDEGAIPALFRRYNVGPLFNARLFEDVMSSGPGSCKSVWDLKRRMDILASTFPGDPERDPSRLEPSVRVDYGYINCRSAEEVKMLDDAYAGVFGKLDNGADSADPLLLHEACVAGKLREYVGRFVKLGTHKAAYKRLLRNVYPLREPVEDTASAELE